MPEMKTYTVNDITYDIRDTNSESHIANKENPHSVTAEQVGARPDTWFPTAEQVGARPDTWFPTAEQVGARPNTWFPTAEQVGAAPAGYGYGEVSSFIYIAGDTDGAQTTAQIETDFAALGDGKSKRITICDPSSLKSGYAYEGKMYRLSTHEGSLELFGGDAIAVKRSKINGTWQPWEWLNPPMVPGVEYRTTERWNGSPVYTKLIDCGAWASDKNISIDTGTGIKRYTGNIQDIALPFTGYAAYNRDDPYQAWIEANSGFILLRSGSGFNGRQTYAQLWYTR